MGAHSDYDPKIKETEVGAKLYRSWSSLPRNNCSPEFLSFGSFYKWAMENGGDNLDTYMARIEKDKEYGPDNCVFMPVGYVRDVAFICKWNKTVNVFRRHFGLQLFKEE